MAITFKCPSCGGQSQLPNLKGSIFKSYSLTCVCGSSFSVPVPDSAEEPRPSDAENSPHRPDPPSVGAAAASSSIRGALEKIQQRLETQINRESDDKLDMRIMSDPALSALMVRRVEISNAIGGTSELVGYFFIGDKTAGPVPITREAYYHVATLPPAKRPGDFTGLSSEVSKDAKPAALSPSEAAKLAKFMTLRGLAVFAFMFAAICFLIGLGTCGMPPANPESLAQQRLTGIAIMLLSAALGIGTAIYLERANRKPPSEAGQVVQARGYRCGGCGAAGKVAWVQGLPGEVKLRCGCHHDITIGEVESGVALPPAAPVWRQLVSDCPKCGTRFQFIDQGIVEDTPFCPTCGYDVVYGGKRPAIAPGSPQSAIISPLPAGIVRCDKCGKTNRSTGAPGESIVPFDLDRCQSCRKAFCSSCRFQSRGTCPHCGKISQYVYEGYGWV